MFILFIINLLVHIPIIHLVSHLICFRSVIMQIIFLWWTLIVSSTTALELSPSASCLLCFTVATTRFYTFSYIIFIHQEWFYVIITCFHWFTSDTTCYAVFSANLLSFPSQYSFSYLFIFSNDSFCQNRNRDQFPYERRPTSKAYIPAGEGDYYYTAAVWGGYLEEMYKLVK